MLGIPQADAVGSHMITVTNDILRKLDNVGKDLDGFSLDKVKMSRGIRHVRAIASTYGTRGVGLMSPPQPASAS